MFLKFCSDNVSQVSQAACPALADILEKFNDDEIKQAGIVRVVRNRYFKAKTFKKRQLYVIMCKNMMNKKELFEKYFKLDFLSLVNDRVPNVRIGMSKVMRHHFLKEISGAMVYDLEVKDAVRVMKMDKTEDVKQNVSDIETYPSNDPKEVTVESFIQTLTEIRMSTTSRSDTDSMNSEDEYRIESEIKRHNSEEEIDHGPVLKSLRMARQKELEDEEHAKKVIKDAKRKEKDVQDMKAMLDEATEDDLEDKKEDPVEEKKLELEAKQEALQEAPQAPAAEPQETAVNSS